MKILPFLQEKIKQPSVIGFLCALSIYASVFSTIIIGNLHKKVAIQENGHQTISMKIASVNSGGQQTNLSKAPPKPKKHKKHKTKPKPSKQPIPEQKEEPIIQEEAKKEEKSSNITQEGNIAEALAYNEGISDEFLSQIRLAISNNNPYPRIARIRGLEGEVTVEFILNIDGSLEGLKILQSTAGDILNKTALKAINNACKQFPIPKHKVRIKVPIIYSLAKG